MTSFFRKLKWLGRRPNKEAELQEELQFHLEEEAGDRQAQGLTSEQARRAARRQLGNVALVHEDARAVWTWIWVEQLAQDIRYALRTIAANKTFSTTGDPVARAGNRGQYRDLQLHGFDPAALAAGADPQSLVILSWRTPKREMKGTNRHRNSYADPNGGFIGGFFSYPAFELLRSNDSVFSSVFGYQGAGKLNLTFRGHAELADTEYVSGDYFRGLGVPPAAGRLIAPDDDRAGAPAVAVISFALSQRRFGGPANASGQSILINNLPFTVIGVDAARVLWRRSRPASGRLCSDARQPASGGRRLRPIPQESTISTRTTIGSSPWRGCVRASVRCRRRRPWPARSSNGAASANPKRRAEDIPTLVVREGAGGLDSLRRHIPSRYTSC